MKTLKQIFKLAASAMTPVVGELIEYIKQQGEVIQKLKDEIAILKGQKPKPKIKPSNLEKDANTPEKSSENKKRPGSKKKSKTKQLAINEEKIIQPKSIPKGSEFKGYKDFVVQDLVIKNWNTCYRRARYKTPDGNYIIGKLPNEVSTHFGLRLTAFILYQYYHAHVTQPLIFEQLQEYGINISTGQISRIISENKERYHKEKEMILSTGLKFSDYINVDDTGARHNGKNGYCTHIGNDFFAWFKSTKRKTRINFLELLRGGHCDYVIDENALEYMKKQRLSINTLDDLRQHKNRCFKNKQEWQSFLKSIGIVKNFQIKAATEGALIGSLFLHDFNKDLVIVSDDAGQFNILQHALCWIHAERVIQKLTGFTKKNKALLETVKYDIWNFYSKLKAYKVNPAPYLKEKLDKRFDEIFNQKTSYILLNSALSKIFKNKSELLMVLERPDIPLHNNLSESDIREYVKKRKISGSTRSPAGQTCRDTFASIKKTCRKLDISFWAYLIDRITDNRDIPLLPDIMKIRMKKNMLPMPSP